MEYLIIKLLLFLPIIAFCQITTYSSPAEKVKLEPLFSDNMVFQQNAPLPVWGKASPNGRVTVILDAQIKNIKAAQDSTWEVVFTPLKATDNPIIFMVIGKDTLKYKNVVVGEVWIGSGQSNIYWPVWNKMARQGVINGPREVENADFPLIRILSLQLSAQKTPQDRVPAEGWKACSPATIGNFSAVAYFFGRDIFKKTGTPIGLIESSWGATPIQVWISEESYINIPKYMNSIKELIRFKEITPAQKTEYRKIMDAWLESLKNKDPGYHNSEPFWAQPNISLHGWQKADIPSLWKDHFKENFNGVVWYRKSFTLPTAAAGQKAILHLGAIDDADITWMNGIQVGMGTLWNKPRTYEVPAGVLHAGKNILTIRVTNEIRFGGFWNQPDAYYLEASTGIKCPLAGTWLYKEALDFNMQLDKPGKMQSYPTALFNGMINPLIPFAMRGVIWYQGESNDNPEGYTEYRELLPLLINDWRNHWNRGNFPFYIVQLANFMKPQNVPVEDGWANLREAQLITAQTLPNTGLAVTIDIGDANTIHPRNKQDVGKRLALWARHDIYGENDLAFSGPLYKDHKIKGDTIVIIFDHLGDGLTTFDGNPLTGFAIAGLDGKFVWANATIQGSTVVVNSKEITTPTAVRYGWANNPIGNLANKNGLPASPFRTDPDNN